MLVRACRASDAVRVAEAAARSGGTAPAMRLVRAEAAFDDAMADCHYLDKAVALLKAAGGAA